MQTGRILFPDRSAAHPLHRGRVKINRSSLVHCDVIGVIENLSDGQWNVLTKDMQDMTRLEFVKTCLGLISYLSKSTFKRYLPVVEILESCKLHTDDSYDSQKSPEAPVSPQASSPLDTPYNHYILAQIVEEVKLALFVAIKRITSTKDSTQSSKGMMLEEETVKAIYERLDTLNILANVNNHEEVVLDSEARAMTVQVVISVLNLIESSNLNKKQAGEISKVLHEIAAKIKILASPKTSKQNLSFGSPSISCPLKGELYLQLSPDFPVKVSQTVLAMLLRGKNNSEALEDRTCHSNSLPSTTPKHRPDLSYIVTVDSIVFKIVITILASIALIPGFNDEIIFSSAMDMFHKILNEVEQFMTLSKTSVRKNKTDIASLQPSQHSLEDDVTTMCTKKVILQIYHAYLSNRSKVEQHKTAPGRESEVSVVDHVMIQLNTLADTRSSTQQPFQSNLDGSNESTKKVISPDFQSMAHRKVSKVLAELDTFREKASLGHVDSFAADIVETVMECLQDLSHIIETVNSVYAHHIYQNIESKIRDLILKQGQDACSFQRMTSQKTTVHDLHLKEHTPQGVVCSSLASVEELHLFESHTETTHEADVISYTEEVIRGVVTLFVLEEIKRLRSTLVDGLSTPSESKEAIARILSQIEDPQDVNRMQGYIRRRMKTLSSEEFELKAIRAVSDVLLSKRDRAVSAESSQTSHLPQTMEHHVSSITKSAIHLLQKMQRYQDGYAKNSCSSGMFQTVQDKVKDFFILKEGHVSKEESHTKLENQVEQQAEVSSLSVKPLPQQSLDDFDLTNEFESRPASPPRGLSENLPPDEVPGNKMDEDVDAGSCMKDVFKKVLTLYIHKAKKKEKEDVSPVDDDLITESVNSIHSQLESTLGSHSSSSYYIPEKTLCEHILCGHNCHSKQSSESSSSSSEAFSLSSETIKRLSSEEFYMKPNELVNEVLCERMEDSSFASTSSLTSSLTSSMDQTSSVILTVIDTLKTLLCYTPPCLRRTETMSEMSSDQSETSGSDDLSAYYAEKEKTSYVSSLLKEVQEKIKEFFNLYKKSSFISVSSTSEVDGGSIPGTAKPGAGYDTSISKQRCSSKNAMSDGIACQLCQDTTSEAALDQEFISSGEMEMFSCDLTYKLVNLLRKNTCQRPSQPTDLGPPLLCRGNDETDKSASLKDPYMFVEASVKCFLHQLLFPSCPSKVIDPEDFIQRTPSSNLCMAKAVHESCSGDSTCSSHDAKSIPAVGLSTQYVENPSVKDVACSTSSLGLIIGLHTDSANKLRKPKRKVKTEVKICIKPKIRTLRINNKYLSKKNAVSPMLFEAYARASKLQENYMQKGTTGLHNERHPTSSSQTEKNSTVPTLLEGQGIFQICLQRGV
ncbi:uncharacterized protein LOC125294176 isoform X1 [Alosa alosa]|uniref:uncharacterized protein LOC125294176 isoform X1 n=2 Tax=Alosa alosa TaxID=278164 RepID=UPI00201517F1|nr:uncharacterized protein LOC125294176 isoform X1 [Alosa alosa]XP_048098557.1 uncharacterized protein LOC125294176 isoform X1 [Alosa alosa]